MGSPIEARTLIKTLLNNNVVDPFPGTRKGVSPQHFYDQTDGLNLSRADSFPKGYITSNSTTSPITDLGKTGHITRTIEVNVWYFVKDKISYTPGTVKYQEEDYVEYMRDLIFKTLIANKKLNNTYHIKTFDSSEGPQRTREGTFMVYYDVVTFQVYWDEAY